MRKRRNFCEISSTFYKLSKKKEILKRYVKDAFCKERFSTEKSTEKLPTILSSHSSNLIKRGKGIDLSLQENKAVNIAIASSKINGMVIHPGEVFSFWRTVGKPCKRKGYKDGRVITNKGLIPGVGGGLCNLGHTINLLILHSPLDIIESYRHSDALAPDEGQRIPFSSGTSVSFNYVDYRFKNNTDQDVQLLLWCEEGKLWGELRSQTDFPYTYCLTEEDHHFRKEGDRYYRVSKVYRHVVDKASGKPLAKELIWDNHSLVMFDHSQIPPELIR
ncbi:MAG: VanW family protein [Oscillospiraceae bacterium]|nr:VanW family protein [Oscillospiraceae bacterium]